MRRHQGSALSGMTLLEVLVAMTLGMMLIGLAWTAFMKTKDAAARTSTRVELHSSASVYRELFQRDFANLSPATAMFGRSTPQVVNGTDKVDTVEVVFMRTIAPLRAQFSESEFMSDYHWVRWRFKRVWRQVGGVWTIVDHTLYRSASTPTRRWQNVQSIVGPNLSTYDSNALVAKPNGSENLNYLNLPRPLRDASNGIPSLDYNKYNTPAASIVVSTSGMMDIGDLTDLDRNETVSTTKVGDFMIGWVDAGGQIKSLTSSTLGDERIHGLYMDVVGPAGNNYLTPLARRPRVIRITMNLVDGNVSQTFTFSIATPGLAPQYRP